MPFERDVPYDRLPMLPPLVELETRAVLKQAIAANRVLANLKGLAGQINQAMLINSIVLQEAKVSSEIENIVTTNDELFRADADAIDLSTGGANWQTKEVLRYRQALYYGFDQLRNGRLLSTNLFVEIAQIIKKLDIEVRSVPGTALRNGRHEIIYTPPSGEDLIRGKLANLEQFIHGQEDGLDPLVKMAVIHYQFEAIHPFADGNGRTGRILNLLYLVHAGLLAVPLLFLSRYVIEHHADYYDGLRGVTEEQDWETWILFVLRAVESTAQQTFDQVTRICELMRRTQERMKTELPGIYSKDLVEAVFRNPYTKIQFVIDSGLAKRQTASSYLQDLAQVGILRAWKKGREVYYINDALLAELRR